MHKFTVGMFVIAAVTLGSAAQAAEATEIDVQLAPLAVESEFLPEVEAKIKQLEAEMESRVNTFDEAEQDVAEVQRDADHYLAAN